MTCFLKGEKIEPNYEDIPCQLEPGEMVTLVLWGGMNRGAEFNGISCDGDEVQTAEIKLQYESIDSGVLHVTRGSVSMKPELNPEYVTTPYPIDSTGPGTGGDTPPF